jgi:hypothetical protein
MRWFASGFCALLQVGTTVSVTELFKSMPVRQKEFVKNIRKVCSWRRFFRFVTDRRN